MTPIIRRLPALPWTVAVLLVIISGGEAGAGSMFPTSVHDAGILARDIVTGDFNADGIVDLAVLSQGHPPIEAGALRALLGNGDGSFHALPPIIIGQTPFTLLAGDLSLDGTTDLVIDMAGSGGFRVLLSNGDGTFQAAADITITTSSARGVLADFTGDARPDLLVVKGTTTATFEVYNGAGDGTFVAPPAPTAVPSVNGEIVVGDVNLDGRADVVTGTGGAGARVFLGNGDGTFNPVLGVSVDDFRVTHVADMDRDGRPDLVRGSAGGAGGGEVSMYRGNGDGTFQEPAAWLALFGFDVWDVSAGDINGDGWPDVVATGTPFHVQTLLGAGGGALGLQKEYQIGEWPYRTVLADFDGRDGSDLALVAVNSHSVFVLLAGPDGAPGQPHLNPVPIPFGSFPRATVMADFDQDGIADLAGPRHEPDGGTTLVGMAPGLGGGEFGAAMFHDVGIEPSATLAADLDGDGVPDLATTNIEFFGFQPAVPGSVSVLIGVGNGDFLPETRYTVGFVPVAISGADLDGDGDIDLVITNQGVASSGFQESLSILAGNGDGTFAPQQRIPAGTHPMDLEIADLTGDGDPDLAVVALGVYPTEPAELSLLPGAAGLTFGARTVLAQGMTLASLDTGDLDGDGDIDIVTADGGSVADDSGVVDMGHSKVFLNDGAGSFTTSATLRAGVYADDARIEEFNGDGIPDIMVVNLYSDDVAIFPGQGGGAYGPAERYARSQHSVLLVGSFDDDARPDLIVHTADGIGAYLNVGRSTPLLRLGTSPGFVFWGSVPFSPGYDVVKGDLSALPTGGFSLAILGCLHDDGKTQSLKDLEVPAVGGGFFYLVRAIMPSGAPGTYDSEGPGQAAPRDAAIASSALACP